MQTIALMIISHPRNSNSNSKCYILVKMKINSYQRNIIKKISTVDPHMQINSRYFLMFFESFYSYIFQVQLCSL